MPNYCRAAGGLLVGAGVPNEISAKIFNKIALETFFFASQHEIGEQNDLTNWANSKSGLRGICFGACLVNESKLNYSQDLQQQRQLLVNAVFGLHTYIRMCLVY